MNDEKRLSQPSNQNESSVIRNHLDVGVLSIFLHHRFQKYLEVLLTLVTSVFFT